MFTKQKRLEDLIPTTKRLSKSPMKQKTVMREEVVFGKIYDDRKRKNRLKSHIFVADNWKKSLQISARVQSCKNASATLLMFRFFVQCSLQWPGQWIIELFVVSNSATIFLSNIQWEQNGISFQLLHHSAWYLNYVYVSGSNITKHWQLPSVVGFCWWNRNDNWFQVQAKSISVSYRASENEFFMYHAKGICCAVEKSIDEVWNCK